MIYSVLILSLIGIGLMIYRREWMLPILVFSLPFDRLPSFDFHDVTLRISTLLFLAACIILLFEIFKKKRKIVFQSYWLYLIAYLIIAFISLISAGDKFRGAIVIGFTIYAFIVFFVSAQLIKKENLKLVVQSLLISSAIVSIFGLYQYIGDVAGLSIGLTGLRAAYTKVVFGFPRIQSTMIEPLYFANFMLIPLGLIIVAKIKDWKIFRSWQFVLTVLFGLVFILTMSRGAFIAAFIMIGMISVVFWKSFNWSKIGYFTVNLVIVLGLSYAFISLPDMLDKIKTHDVKKSVTQEVVPSKTENFIAHTTDKTDGSALDRLSTYKSAYEIWKTHPVIGIGIGNFGYYMNQKNPGVSSKQIVNNEVLELLAETGILGFGAIFGFMICLIFSLYKVMRKKLNTFEWSFAAGLICVMVATMVQYQFFSTLYIVHIWALLGLMAGLAGGSLDLGVRKINDGRIR